MSANLTQHSAFGANSTFPHFHAARYTPIPPRNETVRAVYVISHIGTLWTPTIDGALAPRMRHRPMY